MSTYISVCYSQGAHGTPSTKWRLGVQINGKTIWYRIKEHSILKAGNNLFDLGVTEWIFNQSVDDYEKYNKINIKAIIAKGYEERKNTIRSPKDTCISKIFAHCDKPEFLSSLNEEEIKIYYLLKKNIDV